MLVSGDVGKVALSTAPMVYHPVYLSEIVDMHAPWLCETSEVRMLGMVFFFCPSSAFFRSRGFPQPSLPQTWGQPNW